MERPKTYGLSLEDYGTLHHDCSNGQKAKNMIVRRFSPVRACLFDLDGLLIDSEDIYHRIDNTVLHENGRSDLPWSIKAQMQGRPGPVAHRIFQEWAQIPSLSAEEHRTRVRELARDAFDACKPLPGVESLLSKLAGLCRTSEGKKVHLAIVTSSSKAMFELKTRNMSQLLSHFPQQNIIVGDDVRLKEGRGKPMPDMYLLGLETINHGLKQQNVKPVAPEECLVFEDSVLGVESGRRAGMRVVWCPHVGILGEFKEKVEDVLAGRTSTNVDNAISKSDDRCGTTGELNDGWAEMLLSLKNLDLEKYGLTVLDSEQLNEA